MMQRRRVGLGRAASCLAATCAGALLTASCGSTVAQRTTIVGSGGLGQPPGAAPAAQAPDSQATGSPSEPGSTPVGLAGAGVTPAGSPTPGLPGLPGLTGIAGPGPAPGTSGRGYDAKNIYIGLTTEKDQNQAAEAAGYQGLDAGDYELDAHAVIDQLNAAGGLFGRHLVPRFHDSSTASLLSNPDQEQQTTCTYFTQDAPVVTVVNTLPGLDGDVFYSCLANARVPFVTSGLRIIDRKMQMQYAPYLHAVAAPTWDAFVPVFVSQLERQGYFAGWDTSNSKISSAPVKIGLVYSQASGNSRGFGLLARALAAAGYKDITTFVYSNGFSDTPQAVLRFHANGVTHVIIDEAVVEVFAQAAEQQHYRPRYGLQTVAYPAVAESTSPAAQMVGALGVGWIPTSDVDSPSSTGSAQSSCLKAVTAEGRNYGTNWTAIGKALGICDAIRLAAVSFKAGGGLDAVALARGFGVSAPDFIPALTFRSGGSDKNPSLVGAARDFEFSGQCSCLRYNSPIVPL